jgi:DNA-binding MarR family transcriptional regulator
MPPSLDSRHPLIGLSDEISRLQGRLKSTFAGARRAAGLNESELMVLNAVVEAERLPTVPQIGRSLGNPRQLVQRAADALMRAGLIEAVPNPDHKRAALLRATAQGIALKRQADAWADDMASGMAAALDPEAVIAVTRELHALRKQLEAQLRGGEA